MRIYLQLLKNFLSANYDRERKNFIRIFIAQYLLFCIGVLRAVVRSNSTGEHPMLVLGLFGATAVVAATITLILQLVLVSVLAYSVAFRRAREASISVPDWLRSDEYHLNWKLLLKMPERVQK